MAMTTGCKPEMYLPDALELAALMRPWWGDISDAIPASHPRNEGDDDADDDKDDANAKGDADDKSDDDADDDKSSEDGGDKGEPDWKRMARKHEREGKKARAERDALAKKLAEREDADKDEHQKAIDAARQEGEQEALSKFEQTRREDRIEMEAVKLAGKTLKIGDGDKAVEATFADADDAYVWVERAIRRGELDYDDIYADGKVKRDGLAEFLTDLLTTKPHLRASNGAKPRETVDFDAGKGKGADKGELSVEDIVKAKQVAPR
jgi:hypothetical protein